MGAQLSRDLSSLHFIAETEARKKAGRCGRKEGGVSGLDFRDIFLRSSAQEAIMDHSFEEIRAAALDLLAGRERTTYELTQYQNFLIAVADALERRDGSFQDRVGQFGVAARYGSFGPRLSDADSNLFLEVFWSLFREGVISLGLNDSNREFPFFHVSAFGRKLIINPHAYFFHDVSSYEKQIKSEVPSIDDITLLYLKESMQSFRASCILASSVMLGVATEHTFLLLLERIDQNATHGPTFSSVNAQKTILQKVNKFKSILDQQMKGLPANIKEDIDTHFAGILSIIRNFRNQSGHPSGKILDREQAYVLLQLFIPYCKKMYQLMDHFG
jgi:hypothetical protein